MNGSQTPIVFKPHSLKQEQALRATKRILLLATGVQYGKTTVGAVRMRKKLFQYTDKDDAFIITAPTYKTLWQSTLPAFLKIMEGYGQYNKKHDVFEMNRGGKVYCRTETDPDSVVGITNVRHIWGDEAGKYRLYFWENLQGRADFFGCDIDLTTSPYSLNWIFKDLIKPFKRGLRTDLDYIAAASWENPYHFLSKPGEKEAKKLVMSKHRYDMLYGGEFHKMQGLVYGCWSDEENYIDPFILPPGTRFFAGIDWGYNPDPFGVKIRAITPDGRHYGVSEFFKTRMTINEIVELLLQKRSIWPFERAYCDPSQPGYIEELKRNGIPAVGSDNDIRRGIDLQYEIIKSRKYKEFRGTCPHSADERETYHYPEPKNLGPDEASKEQLPVDANNHAMDIDRYLTLSTYRKEIKHEPHMPGGKSKLSRLEYLKKADKIHQGSEKWT